MCWLRSSPLCLRQFWGDRSTPWWREGPLAYSVPGAAADTRLACMARCSSTHCCVHVCVCVCSVLCRSQQQQQRLSLQGGSSSPCDGDTDSRQGSLGPASRRASQEPPAAAAAAAAGGARSSDQHKQQQQANGLEQAPSGPQQAAAAAAGARPSAAAAARRGEGVAGGRASEISDLLVAYDREAPQDRKAATQQAVAGLCSLAPLDAVCAISMTLDRLVKQSDAACMPHVSQLLLDLAAFAANGASEAGRAAKAAAAAAGKQGGS